MIGLSSKFQGRWKRGATTGSGWVTRAYQLRRQIQQHGQALLVPIIPPSSSAPPSLGSVLQESVTLARTAAESGILIAWRPRRRLVLAVSSPSLLVEIPASSSSSSPSREVGAAVAPASGDGDEPPPSVLAPPPAMLVLPLFLRPALAIAAKKMSPSKGASASFSGMRYRGKSSYV